MVENKEKNILKEDSEVLIEMSDSNNSFTMDFSMMPMTPPSNISAETFRALSTPKNKLRNSVVSVGKGSLSSVSTGEILNVEEFIKLKCIGKGAYGTVYLVDFRG